MAGLTLEPTRVRRVCGEAAIAGVWNSVECPNYDAAQDMIYEQRDEAPCANRTSVHIEQDLGRLDKYKPMSWGNAVSMYRLHSE
jgi:hypothetical protein